MTSRIQFSRPVQPVTATAPAAAGDNDPRKDSERKRPAHAALADEFSRQVAEEQKAPEQPGLLSERLPSTAQIGVHNALAIQNALKK